MYSNDIIYKQVKQLFTELPEYRDNRFKTLEYITIKHYAREYGKGIVNNSALAFNIDRAFREVQRDCPELRGKTWLKRQLMAGEINKETYSANANDGPQLNLFE